MFYKIGKTTFEIHLFQKTTFVTYTIKDILYTTELMNDESLSNLFNQSAIFIQKRLYFNSTKNTLKDCCIFIESVLARTTSKQLKILNK